MATNTCVDTDVFPVRCMFTGSLMPTDNPLASRYQSFQYPVFGIFSSHPQEAESSQQPRSIYPVKRTLLLSLTLLHPLILPLLIALCGLPASLTLRLRACVRVTFLPAPE